MGDNADMCFIELVDFNENMLNAKAPAKAKTARRGKKKSTDATAKTVDKKEEATESTDEAPKSE
jgi:large subunit ribosomal protein L17